MYTCEQIAEFLGVEKTVAYGFVHLLTELGLVETDKAPKVEGKKGKRAVLYKLDRSCMDKLSTLLSEKLPAATPAQLEAVVLPVDESTACCAISA